MTSTPTSMMSKGKKCKHCKMPIAIRNPSGFCDHLYYPKNCEVCSGKTPPARWEEWEEEIKTIIDKFDFHIATGSLKSSLAVVDGVDELVDIYTPEDKLKAFLIIKIRSLCSQAYEEGKREAVEEVEQLRTQLAGCSVAALGGTKNPAKRSDWGWSQSYQDVLDLRKKFDALKGNKK